MNYKKYKNQFKNVNLTRRKWPNKTLKKAPIWCSVDLRDGNQALPSPMTIEEKLILYKILIKMGFKQIEVCFPSASDTEFIFIRTLIEKKLIPNDVFIQVLTQAKENLIKKTFEAIQGIPNSIVHMYNSTSIIQRNVVFNKNKKEIKEIATNGIKLIKELASKSKNNNENVILEYSPESFTGTELSYSVEICNEIIKIWNPTKKNKIIFNLPATIELSTPNIYADQIEWFAKNIIKRDSILISLHTHNDRGTGIAATELGLLAGADRVEGTLFGNGERTGNADLITLIMNFYSQGINPKIHLYNINEIQKIYEEITKFKINPRHPYIGELVYTAFSGSHQDAINKGLKYLKKNKLKTWEVPYLPIDPKDLGRSYKEIIRINSQSGKGGVAFILEEEYGFKIPKIMQHEISFVVKKISDKLSKELSKKELFKIFKKNFLNLDTIISLKNYSIKNKIIRNAEKVQFLGTILYCKKKYIIKGEGSGPLSSFLNSIKIFNFAKYNIIMYEQHAQKKGENSKAIAYVQLENLKTLKKIFGIGYSKDITSASLKAILSAINKDLKK